MLSLDISRDAFQRSKNYTGLRQQHGRVLNESELNEGSDIAAEELRRAIQDVICSSGTSDDGFRVSFANPGRPASYDFDLASGTYYIGGRRYDCYDNTTALIQPDWLQRAFDLSPPPALPTAARHDFVYLEGWEQAVSATEDSELFERALAGADGAGRLRRMTRVHIVPDTADNCVDAMEALFPDGSINPDTMALNTGAGLTIEFDPDFVEENLCAPEVQTGFQGAENETFRVQLTADDRFIFGRDNASHLYRVSLSSDADDINQTIVTFLTQPRDVHSQPLADQTVEILRWTTTLPNGEHLAEPMGQLAGILTDYDPEHATMRIAQTLSEIDVNWDGVPSDETFFYLRIWTSTSALATQDHQIINGTAHVMPGTGLTAQFALAPDGSFGRPGDYWVVAARPNAPDVVTPWQLMEDAADTPPAAPPHGPMRHVAPLALISWDADAAGNIVPQVHDCRERFRKLCKVPTCCEVTVGDGEHSHGDVTSIADAIARLPLTGGKVCLQRGTFVENVDLQNRNNITFTGCGTETIWRAEAGPAVTLTNCHKVTFDNFTMEAEADDVVRAGSRSGLTDGATVSSGLHFARMRFHGRDQTALWLNDCDDIQIVNCHIEMRALAIPRTVEMGGTDPAVFALGDDILIEGNWIGVTQDPVPPAETRPMGGVQIGGTSEGVIIRSNQIVDGKGNGIAFGHLEWVVEDDGIGMVFWTLGSGWMTNDAGCLVPVGIPFPPQGVDPTVVPESGGNLRNIVVADNLIQNMGLNGIAVSHFFDLASFATMISIADLRIERNEIRDCLTSDLETPDPEISYFQGHGGIALASCDLIYIRDNRIHDNGRNTAIPVCGIFILFGAGVEIDDNHIFANGTATQAIGRLGGVNVGWCITYATSEPDRETRATPMRRAALAMSGNVIDSPSGQAIKAVALGPVQVTNNQLVGTARSVENEFMVLGALITLLPPVTSIANIITALVITDGINRDQFAGAGMLLAELMIMAMGGHAVSIFNAGWLEEFSAFLGGGTGTTAGTTLAPNFGSLFPPVGGETMFNNNQVTLLPAPNGPTNPVSSVLVASMDDVSLVANQIEADNGVGFILTNAFTPAATVRMTSNRIQETPATCLFSGLSHSVFLNTQSLNQGTHCFAATALLGNGPFAVQRAHNLSLLDSLLATVTDNGYCAIIEERLSGLFSGDGFGGRFTGEVAGEATQGGGATGTPTTSQSVTVPNVMCDSEVVAIRKLENAQLGAEPTFWHISGAKERRVLRQDPAAGTQTTAGNKIKVWVGVNDSTLPSNDEADARYNECLRADKIKASEKPIYAERLDYDLGSYAHADNVTFGTS